MRILYCNKYNFPFSGTESYLFEAMRLVQQTGHETALFSMTDDRGAPTPYDHHFLPHVDFKRSDSLLKRAALAAHVIYSTSARRRIRGMIAEFRPDVAHVRNIYHHLSPSILWELKKQSVPVLYHINDFKLLCPSYNMVSHGHACERCARGHSWRVISDGCYAGSRAAAAVLAAEASLHGLLRTYERCVDLFLAPSRFVKDTLVAAGWDRSRIEVLPHFQDLPSTVAPPPRSNAPVLYFGRLSAEKGVNDLLYAMSGLRHIPLKIAGDGPERKALESTAHLLGLRNIEFLGHVTGDALDQLVRSAAFTVLPSHAYETFGKTIVESYAQGRGVIATDLGSRRELVTDGETGLLYKTGDIVQLRRTIEFLYDRPQLAASMGAAGRQQVKSCYAPEQHLRALLATYDKLARHPAAKVFSWPRRQPLPIKVVFVGGRGLGSRYSGIEASWEEIGKRLAADGHNVTVYCRSYFTPPETPHGAMRLVRLPTIRTKHLDTLVHTLLSTIHLCFNDSRIVHYQALGPALFSFLPRLFGKRTVVTVQGLDWQRKKWGWFASRALRAGEWAAAHLPDSTIVVSHALQRHFQNVHGILPTLIPNGTVLREPRAPRYILDWKLTPGEYVLYLGRFSPEKNCDLLIRAFERTNSQMKLVLAGGSSHSADYARDLRRHQSSRIRFLDWVSGDAFDELLTNAALFVLPSDLEGLSLALLDAMGAGVCVLTSDIAENREVVDGAGFTFRAGDADDLQRMLQLLMADPELRAQSGTACRQRVAEKYLWPEITVKLEQLYTSLLGTRTTRSESPVPEEKQVAAAAPAD
ncbi:MAG: glycosyltransferase [Acidobacteriales bacterium]|nr:glycosyltransferase [Terriglobales bacterium]